MNMGREGQGFVGAKQIGIGLGLAFAITLAVVVAKQMTTEAMAVVIGVVCGVAASIPTSAWLLVVLTRRDRQKEDEPGRQARQTAYPPVVVIQGGAPQALPMGMQPGYWPAPSSAPAANRQFHVVGNDGLLLDGD